MKAVYLFVIVLSFFVCRSAVAQKLMVAHVAINPNQGLVWITKDAGFLAKYGLTAEIVLIPGSPRTVQALIAGDLDYAIAGAPAVLRARMQGADVVVLSSNSGFSSQRVLLRPDSTVASLSDLKGKMVGVTQYGSAGDSLLGVFGLTLEVIEVFGRQSFPSSA
jgi:ABC-type nitrate/sulfonate/bicarbonate transport system substrate-binding protein